MDLKRFCTVPENSTYADAALLAIRVVAGLAFMKHGWTKIQDPTGWMGPEPFAPGIFLALAAFAEFGGGAAWILGLLTPLASLGITSTMVVAMWFHGIKRGDPFVSAGGGPAYELAAIYFCLALLLIAVGPGRISLDRRIFGSRSADRQ